ncbi:trifunctional histidinol dehydrogenase [Mycoemilia scoparia]|uniref:Histidine biosynthesis trifunctional protein n=1 Tax=Mycoemilia scoparia TaxID=417184 RepID=A0A9W7ZN31_9FUNG|nr:trifunctional histidinol dehydrogenase [Mycoemilia scoparia]
MLIPKVLDLNSLSPEISRAINCLPTRLFVSSPSNEDAGRGKQQGNWVILADEEFSSIDIDGLISILDQGYEGVIFPNTKALESTLFSDSSTASSVIPQSRLGVVVTTEDDSLDQIKSSAQKASLIIIPDTLIQTQADNFLVEAVKLVNEAGLLDNKTNEGGSRRLAIEITTPDVLKVVEQLAPKTTKAEFDFIVNASSISIDNIGELFVKSSHLNSDRPGGLFTTVVCDQQNECLGLVYSNTTSIGESLKSGQGVYWSRKQQGLWRKGLTSGATQTLYGVNVDCDSDALKFVVEQHGVGFCHFNTRSCFGGQQRHGISGLARLLESRKESAPEGSYTQRLFNDPKLLKAKIMEEAEELCEATSGEEVAWEAADLLYFALTKCVASGVRLSDIESNLDRKHRKISRRPGNAKPKWESQQQNGRENGAKRLKVEEEIVRTSITSDSIKAAKEGEIIRMRSYDTQELSETEKNALLQRPIIDSSEIISRVTPIVNAVRKEGDKAIREFTTKFDNVQLNEVVIRAPFQVPDLPEKVKAAIDQAYNNIKKFHEAQLSDTLTVETMPGVKCTRFSRPIERVGLYVPGGTAVLPSTALMLGVPAQVAGCREIVIATPPRKDGSVVPEVLYAAVKVGATAIILAGGAQAVASMAYGTETVPKVDKICGPGNQYVTAAKMLAQNDTAAMVSIDMPAGPSEVLVIADSTCIPAFVASDLLSQAEHGPDSQVVLLAIDLSDEKLAQIEAQIHEQALRLPRVDIVRQSIPKSYCLKVSSIDEAFEFSNAYAPEHLILHMDNAENYVPRVDNAGSVFVGHYSPESCGDYASGTNHTLPTYGFARMYSGVNTGTFLKHITSQQLTRDGLKDLGPTVMTLAEVEELEAHRNAVAIRLSGQYD